MKCFKYTVKNQIGIITFRNSLTENGLTLRFYKELTLLLNEICFTERVKALILTAAGENFAIENDLLTMYSVSLKSIESYIQVVTAGLEVIKKCSTPIIAAVNGRVTGSGLVIVACCDLLIASQKAIFEIPNNCIGMVGAARYLPSLIPPKLLNYMVLTGNAVNAYEMKECGGVIKVVDSSSLIQEAIQLTNEVLDVDPSILSYLKDAKNLVSHISGEEIDYLRSHHTNQIIKRNKKKSKIFRKGQDRHAAGLYIKCG